MYASIATKECGMTAKLSQKLTECQKVGPSFSVAESLGENDIEFSKMKNTDNATEVLCVGLHRFLFLFCVPW